MAIIAALRESEHSTLVATDRQQTESDGIEPLRSPINCRLRCHPKAPDSMGTQKTISPSAEYSVSGINKSIFLLQTGTACSNKWHSKLSMLNEHQHRQSRLAGVESKLEELCGVLVVGFLLESRDWQRWDHAKVRLRY